MPSKQKYTILKETDISGKGYYGSLGDDTAVPMEADFYKKNGTSSGRTTPIKTPLPNRRGSITGSVLSFHGISYIVKVKEDGNKIQKMIINNLHGSFGPGMHAIMGPTGGGKTSLLDILAGRKDPAGLTGFVLIDGNIQPENFKCISGYVEQTDLLAVNLTVRENIVFSAVLRMQSHTTKEEREERIEEVIQDLGLTVCANTKIGNEFIRGVSGGEKKRCNIATELVIRPSTLFLDEPTTGLDASTANNVMRRLSMLGRRGRTIIVSIHQPRYSIYRLFDTLHLLKDGQTVYHGPNNEALDYFKGIGYSILEHDNPADFYLDVLIGETNLFEDTKGSGESRSTDNDAVAPIAMAAHFKTTHYFKELQDELSPIMNTYRSTKEHFEREINYPTPFVSQLCIVCKRTLLNAFRNPLTAILQIIHATVLSLFIGAIFFQLDDTYTAGLQNRVGAFFLITVNTAFGTLSALDALMKEKRLFIKEKASGYYRVSSYFIAKVVCDLIPLRLTPIIIYGTIVYWMLGLKATFSAYCIFILALIILSSTATSIIFIVAAYATSAGLASLIIAITFVVMFIFGGMIVNLATLSSWIEWMKYISMFRYTINTLYVNEFVGNTYCDPPVDSQTAPLCITGESYLDEQGIDYSVWGLWQNLVALCCMFSCFLSITYARLRMIPIYT